MNLPLFPGLQPRAALPPLTDGAATDRGPAEPGTWEHAGRWMVGETEVPPDLGYRPMETVAECVERLVRERR